MKNKKIILGIILVAVAVISCILLIVILGGKNAPSNELSSCETQGCTKNIVVNHLSGEVVEKEILGLEIFSEESESKRKNDINEDDPFYGMYDSFPEGIKVENDYVKDEDKDIRYSEISYYENDEKCWTTKISEYWVTDVEYAGDGIYAIGKTFLFTSEDEYAYFSKIDLNGQILFTCKLDHDIESEAVVRVINNGNGTCVAFSYGNATKYICVSQYDQNGEEISCKKLEMDMWIALHDAIVLEDGYLLRVGELMSQGEDYFYRLDSDCNIIDSYFYDSEGRLFNVKDMMEYEGHVYISAYEVGVQKDTGNRYEIDNLLQYIRQKLNQEGSSGDSLAEQIRDEYNAVLFACDEKTGEPVKCFTISGSMGAALSLTKDNQLIWKVERVSHLEYSKPTVNSHSIFGTCEDYEYLFDASGSIIGSKWVGKSLYFR